MSSSDWSAQEAAFFGASSTSNPSNEHCASDTGLQREQPRNGRTYRRYYDTSSDERSKDDNDRAVEEAAETLKQEFKSFRKAAKNVLSNFSTTLNEAIGDIANDYPGNNNHRQLGGATGAVGGGTVVSLPPAIGNGPTRPIESIQIRAPDGSIDNNGLYGGTLSNNNNNNERRIRPTARTTSSSLLGRVAQHVSNHAKNLGVPSCVVCGVMAPQQYQYHTFFPKERACSHHGTSITKCCSCHRFEPSTQIVKDISDEFADLQDNDRKLCPACMRTVVLDTADTIPVWTSVIEFFDQYLNLFESLPLTTKTKMEQIPILMVGHNGLNDPSITSGSGHGRGGNTRGLCMYEYSYHPLGGSLRNFLESYTTSNNSNGVARAKATSVLDAVSKGMTRSEITAILCLKGLPKDLAGSILAHEATHAWFKLHPAFDPRNGQVIPIQVEEGCCQLMAFLYLNRMDELDGSNNNSNDNDYDQETGQPTNKKLRQYFRYCIESDTSEVYGDGFRLAADSYSKLGGSVQLLLEHVVTHFAFPNL